MNDEQGGSAAVQSDPVEPADAEEPHKIKISSTGVKYDKVVLDVVGSITRAKRPLKTDEVIKHSKNCNA